LRKIPCNAAVAENAKQLIEE